MPAGGTDPDPGRVINEIQNYTHLTTDVLVANGTTTPTFKLRIVANEWRVDAAGDHLISVWSYERLTGGTDGEGNTFIFGGRSHVLRSENGYAVAVPV